MNKNLQVLACFILVLFSVKKVFSQEDSVPIQRTYRIGIFAPLYLDSVFSEDGKFRYKQGLPKFITPAVDFINGAQIALDSVKFQRQQVDAFIYDTKSYTLPIDQLIRSKKIDSLNLIIGSVKDVEYKQLADFALAKNIP